MGYNSGVEFRKDKLDIYYIDFTNKTKYDVLFDSMGIPMLNYYGKTGIKYNPTAICQYGLGMLQVYQNIRGEETYLKFIKQADWLVENQKIKANDMGVWEYDYSGEVYGLKSPFWISAISQGLGISLLLRAYVLTGDQKYMEASNKAFKSFLYNVDNGGVVNRDNEGSIFLEEVPTEKVSGILDGFIYAIFGVYDYSIITGDEKAKEIFEDSLRTLENRLPNYDMGFWSRADLHKEKPKMIASVFYHRLHVYQLKVLYEITGRRIFLDYSKKWDNCYNNRLYRALAIAYKVMFKLLYY